MNVKKQFISLLMAVSLTVACMPDIKATDVSFGEYKCFDLTSYANCKAYTTANEISGIVNRTEVPKYIGAEYIFNKNAVDGMKNADGLILDSDNIPFLFKTDADENTILLGGASAIGLSEVEIDVPDGMYDKIYFAADTSSALEEGNSVGVMYKDESEETALISNWSMPRTEPYWDWLFGPDDAIANISSKDNYSSYIKFLLNETDINNSSFCIKNDMNEFDENDSYLLPISYVEVDPTKKIDKITFKNTNPTVNMNIFAVTGHAVSSSDAVNKMIADLPSASELDGLTYEAALKYQATIDAITEMIEVDSGIEFEQGNEAKFAEVKAIIKGILENNSLKAEYLISQLPDADDITSENGLNFNEEIAVINELLTGGTEISEEALQKFESVLDAINNTVYPFNPYKSVDISSKFNGIAFWDSTMTINNPLCTEPNFIGIQHANTFLSQYPAYILNKKAFDNMKKQDGLTYSEGGVPFRINTDKALVLGTKGTQNGSGIYTVDIAVNEGVYDSVSVALWSTFALNKKEWNYFDYTVTYTDGTTSPAEDWLIPRTSNVADYNNSSVADYIRSPYNPSDRENTALVFAPVMNEGSPDYGKYNNYSSDSSIHIPIVTIKTNSEKIVKSINIRLGTNVSSIGLCVLGVTCKTPNVSALKSNIEKLISTLNPNNIVENTDKMLAIRNMLSIYDAYESPNKKPITGRDEFEVIEADYNTKAVVINSVTNITDYDTITSSFNFQNPIDIRNINNYITVKIGKEVFSDYEITTPDNKTIVFKTANDLNYDREFTITISGNLPDEQHSGYTLNNDYINTFKPQPPMGIETFEIKNAEGNPVELKNCVAGDIVTASIIFENNKDEASTYAITTCLYDCEGMLIKSYLQQSTLDKDDKFVENYSFVLPDNASTIKCYVLDGYNSMKKIWKTIEVE